MWLSIITKDYSLFQLNFRQTWASAITATAPSAMSSPSNSISKTHLHTSGAIDVSRHLTQSQPSSNTSTILWTITVAIYAPQQQQPPKCRRISFQTEIWRTTLKTFITTVQHVIHIMSLQQDCEVMIWPYITCAPFATVSSKPQIIWERYVIFFFFRIRLNQFYARPLK